jgi:sulfatase modifying factor 1
MLSKDFFCPIPFNIMKMKNLSTLMVLAALLAMTGCKLGGKSGKGLPDDG